MKNQNKLSLSLESVNKRFNKWRANKASGERVPESLWLLVQQLLESSKYKRSIVARELSISTHQLRSRFPRFYPKKASPKTSINKSSIHAHRKPKGFVEAPLNTVTAATPPTLTIERHDGNKLLITTLNPEQFSSLIKTFME